ncbi:MAG: stage II sporulation protein M [Deltaproteobacteria bacterium]|nr:stage II sporulation protein M [Deltaproteobacteria bacterium]
MIIDIPKFIEDEQPYWSELEKILGALARDNTRKMDLPEIKRFYYLYQRASADLGKIMTFSSRTGIKTYLESLVAKAYCEIHETRIHSKTFSPRRWFLKTFPRAFRAHIKAFYLSVAITMAGCIFGGLAITLDPDAKAIVVSFEHLTGNPSERVKKEEQDKNGVTGGQHLLFSSQLMANNIRVSILAMALGMTLGVGTIILLFYNGVILGAVAVDYILSGETLFLMGWLLPHGVIEIPAIFLGGQAGFILADSIIGRGSSLTLKKRLAEVSRDVVTIISGAAVMLVWAGIIESFFSQYHEPIIPYSAKISFGILELVLLAWLLFRSGIDQKERKPEKTD